MIRVNLLAVERKVAKRARGFETAQKITVACSAVLIVARVVRGLAILGTQQESTAGLGFGRRERRGCTLQQVQVRAAAQLQASRADRAAAKNQSGPVHMLVESAPAPPMLADPAGNRRRRRDRWTLQLTGWIS